LAGVEEEEIFTPPRRRRKRTGSVSQLEKDEARSRECR
jgi:hypothetical protein